MKKSDVVVLSLVVLIAGAYFYKKSQDSKAEQAKNTQVALPEAQGRNYTLLAQRNKLSNDGSFDRFITKLYAEKGMKLDIKMQEIPGLGKAVASDWNYDLGASNIYIFSGLLSVGKKITPLFETDLVSEYVFKVKVITRRDSKISSLKDLANKNIARLRGYSMVNQALIEENVVVNKFYSRANLEWATKALESGKVDALLFSYCFSSKESNLTEEFGSLENGNIEKYATLKVVASKDLDLPCNVVFINDELSKEDEAKALVALREVNALPVNDPQTAVPLLGPGSMREIPEADRSRIIKAVTTTKGDFAKENIEL